MVYEEAFTFVEFRDRIHIFRTQLEVEDVEVLGNPLLVN